MKILFLLILSLAFVSRGLAQIPVTDVANLSQNIVNYAAMIQQLANQAQQIGNQVQQIQQMEDQLKRLGNMANIKALVGFPAFKLDLNLPSKIKTWAENVARVDGRGFLGDTRDGIFLAIAKVDNFKDVQADVYVRRENLRQAIGQTSDALQAADTDAEEKKLAAVLNAQYSQLAELDSEVSLSAAEVQVKAAQSTAMASAQSEADAETRRTLAQQEAGKIGSTFKPNYDSILLYVREEPFRP